MKLTRPTHFSARRAGVPPAAGPVSVDATDWPTPPARGCAAAGTAARRAGRDEAAFTMVEIAISLAVIGFALVAIIGVLPTGMTVQRENREETIINQDATYFAEALRNGAHGLDDLTNFVYAV